MEQKELETLIDELETRVDRLRSLYEQYFMGIERIVPSVPHKDVERRFYVLRRQNIRNTGLRFRFQNVLLKYNTYQTYWMRITRQIEEGTYKRDVRRANARFANPPKSARRGKENEKEEELSDTDVVDALDVDIDVDMEELSTFEDDELARAKEQVAQMRAAVRASVVPKPPPLPNIPRPGGDAPKRDEAARAPKLPTDRLSADGLKYAVRGKRPTSDLPPPPPVAAGVELDDPFAVLETKAPRSEAPKPARPVARPFSTPDPPKRRSSRPDIPRPSPPPPPRPPRPVPRPAPPAQPQNAMQPPALSEARVRQLYSQYVDAKRKAGESTAALTFEGLSRSLRDSTARLKEKHAGKSVDFEVTVKDGKAVLRPVVK